MKATSKALIGRNITGFAARRGHPRVTLDDGRVMSFVVEETDAGDYAVSAELTERDANLRPGRGTARLMARVMVLENALRDAAGRLVDAACTCPSGVREHMGDCQGVAVATQYYGIVGGKR
jgi:hypothetical protein